MVAENSMVCRLLGTCVTIRCTWGMKPRSSMWSASSSTSSSTLRRLTVPRSVWSSSRPGVATRTSGSRRNWSNCGPILTPPIRQAEVTCSGLLRKTSRKALVCRAISRVGQTTSARTPLPRPRRWTIGRTKAAVLPEPVSARPIRSLPAIASGITSAWIGVGCSKPIPASTSRISRFSPRLRKSRLVVSTWCWGIAGSTGVPPASFGALVPFATVVIIPVRLAPVSVCQSVISRP